jgi:hypothetical protein
MKIDHEFQRQVAIVKWIQDHFLRAFQVDKNASLAIACFDLAIEHHSAICALFSSGLYGSLYSLIRIEFEAYARGLWIRHVATNEDIAYFEKNDGPNIGFAALIELVEKKNTLFAGQLSILRSKHWSIFCSFAHTGHQALLRRISEGRTGLVNYEEAEVVSIMSLAGTLALLSAFEFATLLNDKEVLLKL